MKLQLPKLTVWRAIFAAIMLSGLYATYLRVMYGLGGSTNLSDKFPWGIWIGFDVMCGVGLAAGGFTLVAMVLGVEAFEHFDCLLDSRRRVPI
jgi:Ni/Fe-hydrogenase subunit HybB-like protein